MKSLGELITTKVIGQSAAESMSKCGVTFRYLKKKQKKKKKKKKKTTHTHTHTNEKETQQNGLDSILGPFVKGKQ